MQNWRMSELCHSLGLAVPKFIFVAEERWAGLPGRSLSIMEYIEGIPLHLWATSESRTPAEIRVVAAQLAKEIDRLSTAMITHGDCKASNIIVTADQKPYFVDLDGAIQHRSRSAFRK
ncbi:MAG: lipopolysaccharide kinase InaA family protein, partial [Limisphaerales bacterium]